MQYVDVFLFGAIQTVLYVIPLQVAWKSTWKLPY